MSMEVTDLAYRYGERSALRGVTFSIRAGEALFVLGPNGAGKSTLFRCVLGLLRGFSGRIRLDGRDLGNYPPALLARKLAYIPQSHESQFGYTALDIVLMGAAPRLGVFALPGKEQAARAEDALRLLGVGRLRDREFGSLSGGERQLVLIARAVAQDADMFVMDEPAANLDYGNQNRVMREIRRLAESGYAVLVSSHNPDHAFLYADRALALKEGRALGCGAPGQLLTEELLELLYGFPVRLRDVPCGDTAVRVCLPAVGGK